MSDLPIPPQILSIERDLLLTLMNDPAAWDRVGCLLRPEHLSLHSAKVFDAIGALTNSLRPTDMNAVALFLARSAYTRQLSTELIARMEGAQMGDALALARLIQEEYILRKIHAMGDRLKTVSCPTGGAAQALYDLGNDVQKLQEELAWTSEIKTTGDLLVQLLDRIQEADEVEDSPESEQILDILLAAVMPGRLLGLCGPDSTGKTTLAAQLFGAYLKSESPVMFVSLEMPASDIAPKLMASCGNIRLQAIESGKLQDNEWSNLTQAIELLRFGTGYIDDEPNQSLPMLAAKITRLKRRHPDLKMVVIDHLASLSASDGATQEEVAIKLKALARTLRCCILLISHEEAPLRIAADVIYCLAITKPGERRFSSSKGRRGEISDTLVEFDGACAQFRPKIAA